MKPQMKYLKLVLNEELPEGCHITFVYFGRHNQNDAVDVDEELLSKLLASVCPFTLKYDREDLFGLNNDIPVQVYTYNSTSCKQARNSIVSIFNVHDRNYADWTPHISNYPENRGHIFELNVIGVESNDGIPGTDASFRHMFSDMK